jgi:LacI family transcriptional regulator
MATIRDVARRAGVAPITVSRVINGSGAVSDETRERVELAVAELSYVPNRLARSLRSKRTHILALILTDITNPFWTTVTRGVEDAASKAGYSVILCNTDESEKKESQYLRVMLQNQVDGVLLVPARSTNTESVDFIQELDTLVVVLDRRIPEASVDVVRCDSEDGAYRLVLLLLSLGHKRIVFLSGPHGISTAEDRVRGYRCALSEAGLAENEMIFYGAFTVMSGYEMASQLLKLNPRPTAILASNNFIAVGAMRAVREAGLRIPEDMAVVGFDDLPDHLIVEPYMTVAAQPAYEMGQRATELLLNRLSGEVADAHQEIVLPVEVVVRRTSGGPRVT